MWPSYCLLCVSYISMGLDQYNNLGEYCGPHTASSVFLILVWVLVSIIIRRPASALLDKLLCPPGPGGPAAAG